VVGIIIIYILYKELQAFGCSMGFTMQDSGFLRDCDNENGKSVKGTLPYPTDTTDTLYKKIILASKFMDRTVIWRVCILVGFVSAFLIYFFLQSRIPSELELVVSIFVFAALSYFAISFYRFHMISYLEKNTSEAVDILKLRCS
jgi:hypothetical protein